MLETLEMKRQLSPRKIRKAMAAKGWTEKDLSYHADISLPGIKDILSGESGGRVGSLTKIADALGIEDMNSLFDVVK